MWRLYICTLHGGQDLLLLLQVFGDDHGHVDWIFLEPILERRRPDFRQYQNNDKKGSEEGDCALTCRFLLILRMLCWSRKLLSRAKRLC